jgi:hypothetical protein
MSTTHPSYPPDIANQAVVVITRGALITLLVFIASRKLRRRW